MSLYVDFGDNGSEVKVWGTSDTVWCGCGFYAKTFTGILHHLRTHRASGDTIPNFVILELEGMRRDAIQAFGSEPALLDWEQYLTAHETAMNGLGLGVLS